MAAKTPSTAGRTSDRSGSNPNGANRQTKRPSAKQFRFGFLVHDVSRVRRTVIDQILRPYGVTRSQWSVLSALSRSDNDGMMQVDLARLLEMGKVTVGGLIDRLEATGHVERRADKTDRRAKRVFITDQGYEIIGTMVAVSAKMNKRMLKGLTSDEVETVERVMLSVKANLKEMREELGSSGQSEEFGSKIP